MPISGVLGRLERGRCLVAFPAASTIFTSRRFYGLSDSQYGAMFLPMAVLAIATSLLGAKLARRITTKGVYLAGLSFLVVKGVPSAQPRRSRGDPARGR
jgi:uncharacterized membrane protein YfcA